MDLGAAINLPHSHPCSLSSIFLVIDYATCLTDIKNKTPGEDRRALIFN
jgi:hypothetical protein